MLALSGDFHEFPSRKSVFQVCGKFMLNGKWLHLLFRSPFFPEKKKKKSGSNLTGFSLWLFSTLESSLCRNKVYASSKYLLDLLCSNLPSYACKICPFPLFFMKKILMNYELQHFYSTVNNENCYDWDRLWLWRL